MIAYIENAKGCTYKLSKWINGFSHIARWIYQGQYF